MRTAILVAPVFVLSCMALFLGATLSNGVSANIYIFMGLLGGAIAGAIAETHRRLTKIEKQIAESSKA